MRGVKFPFLVLLGLVLCITSCEKELFNYRNKYLGDWDFEVDVYLFNIDSIGHEESYSFTYDGEITYGKEGNEILVIYGENLSVNLEIDKEGDLAEFPTHQCSGRFLSKKEIELRLRWGGHGGSSTYIIKGIKN